MPTPHLPPPSARRAVRKLGEDIRAARLARRLPMALVADRAATSRPTVARIEQGDHSVSIGIVAAVLQALNLVDRLAEVADPARDTLGLDIARDQLPKRAYLPRRESARARY